MNEITIHPNVYATGPSKNLVTLLEKLWVRESSMGDGVFYIVSGFANYNGGVRFFDVFKQHIQNGGHIVAIFAGSTVTHLSSRQVVQELLECGVEVRIVNRKRLLHAKCYGCHDSNGDRVIVTSGNFTGPGMSQNVEMSVSLDADTTSTMNFSWEIMLKNLLAQKWDFYVPTLDDLESPAWKLLYDEQAGDIILDDSDKQTMILTLSHSDTARIQASPGTNASKGTQYFWLSKDCYSFFPPLTIRNSRGDKATYSCVVDIDFKDLNKTEECRVTFEAENNLDFRLGTSPLRATNTASEGDLVAITRVSDKKYELRIFRNGTQSFRVFIPYAIHFIGHRGKKYGFMPNSIFFDRMQNVSGR